LSCDPPGRAPPVSPPLSLPDALPISLHVDVQLALRARDGSERDALVATLYFDLQRLAGTSPNDLHELTPRGDRLPRGDEHAVPRSEEHTSELQSRENLVCRLLLEKKK